MERKEKKKREKVLREREKERKEKTIHKNEKKESLSLFQFLF